MVADTATLGSLLADSPAAVGTLPLASLLVGLIPRGALPFEQLPTKDILASSPVPANGSAGYTIGFDLVCSAATGLAVRPSLPAGFRTVPSTVTMTVGTAADAGEGGAPTAPSARRPRSAAAAPARHRGLQAEPTATLGGPLTAGVTVKNTGESVSISGQAPVTVVDPTDASAATIPTPPGTRGRQ